jgi:hypothetical protein
MRYYKFNRDRSLNPLKRIKSCNKLSYLAKRNNLHMLDSFHFENQTWGALHKAWKGYVIAKNKHELSRMKYYAIVIQKLERELGIKVSSFPELSLMALQFVQDNPEYMDRELTGEEIFKILMERDRDFLTKLYEGTDKEEEQQ